MLGEFDSRKDSHPTKFEQRSRIFLKLNFRELRDAKLSGLHPFGNMVIIQRSNGNKNRSKQIGRMQAHETLILEVIFVTLTENSSVIKNDTQGLQKDLHHQLMALKLSQYFHLLIEKPLGRYF